MSEDVEKDEDDDVGAPNKLTCRFACHPGKVTAWLGLLGLVVVFVYSAQTRFFPKELSTVDSLVFVFALLAFGVIVLVGILYGGFSLLWIFSILDRFNTRRIRRWETGGEDQGNKPVGLRLIPALRGRLLALMSFLVFLLFAVLLLIAHESNPDRFGALWQFVEGFFVAGFLATFALLQPLFPDDATPGYQRIRPVQRLAMLGMAIVALFVFGSLDRIIATTMGMTGIQLERTPIELSASNFARVRALSTTMQATILSSPIAGTDHYLLCNADVLWYGVGTRALLRLDDPKSGPLSIEVDDDGIWPLRTKTQPPFCEKVKQAGHDTETTQKSKAARAGKATSSSA